jgi:hypothetical protein
LVIRVADAVPVDHVQTEIDFFGGDGQRHHDHRRSAGYDVPLPPCTCLGLFDGLAAAVPSAFRESAFDRRFFTISIHRTALARTSPTQGWLFPALSAFNQVCAGFGCLFDEFVLLVGLNRRHRRHGQSMTEYVPCR